jgi:tungstate transport system substrate-binding protein
MTSHIRLTIFSAGLLLLAGGCAPRAAQTPVSPSKTEEPGPAAAEPTAGDEAQRPSATPRRLRLATTTSTRDSGLLDALLPMFERQQACAVDVVAVGTGAALRLGEAGDADVLIVHAPESEQEFMQAGHGRRREPFMFNSFVLLGPPADPAEVRQLDAVAALPKIAATGATFISRGDDSGTHKRELALWQQAGGRPAWPEYLESGQGMGATLVMADEKRGYTLSDEGTYLKFRDKVELVPLTARSESLHNPYAVITIDPSKSNLVQAELADRLLDFLLSEEAQRTIADHRVEGEQLFTPTRLP